MHWDQCGFTFLFRRPHHSLGGLEQRQDPVSVLLISLLLPRALCVANAWGSGQARPALLSPQLSFVVGVRGEGLVVRASGLQSQRDIEDIS